MWKLIWKLSKPNLLETYPSNIFAFPEQFEKKKKKRTAKFCVLQSEQVLTIASPRTYLSMCDTNERDFNFKRFQ